MEKLLCGYRYTSFGRDPLKDPVIEQAQSGVGLLSDFCPLPAALLRISNGLIGKQC